MKKTFWKADWFVGLMISLLFLFASHSEPMQHLERKAYDWGMQASVRDPGDRVAVIAIDDQSIAHLGRWPWPRDIQAGMIDLLAGAHARVIGNTEFFAEPQRDPGLDFISSIAQFVSSSSIPKTSPEAAQLDALLQQAGAAVVPTLLLLLGLAASCFVLMTRQGIWLQLMTPAALLLVGHALLITKRFLLAERVKQISEVDSGESHRNLGLMLQGQGQLDMAFDRFRKCPVDDALLGLLYNLALKFERKRQFNEAEALDCAHGSQVVHRDIKPANVMHQADTGQVKLGVPSTMPVLVLEDSVMRAMPKSVTFMSPEQLSGKQVDGRSDLFSLGVMLYQMASGQLPFRGDSMTALMFMIANEPHASIRTVMPALPECLATIVDRMLEKDVVRRYQHGSDIARDLRKCLEQMG